MDENYNKKIKGMFFVARCVVVIFAIISVITAYYAYDKIEKYKDYCKENGFDDYVYEGGVYRCFKEIVDQNNILIDKIYTGDIQLKIKELENTND